MSIIRSLVCEMSYNPCGKCVACRRVAENQARIERIAHDNARLFADARSRYAFITAIRDTGADDA